LLGLIAVAAALPLDAQSPRAIYDHVILRGRVIDPESRLDAIRNVGITGRTIRIVTQSAIQGRDTIDARGLVVAPGFIDLHAHGQNDESYRYYAMDGVTTALELEIGTWPIAQFYSDRAGKALVNYGAATAHFGARRWAVREETVGGLEGASSDTRTKWSLAPTTPGILDSVRTYLTRELDAGALGIGMGIAYVPGASGREIYRNFQLCAARQVVCFTHVRNTGGDGLIGVEEVVADALATGASLHVVHVNSSAVNDARAALDLVRAARTHGVDVTAESYPYTASSTLLQSTIFDQVDEQVARGERKYGDLIWVATGEHLTAETFRKYRAIGGFAVALNSMPDSAITIPLADTAVIVATDGIGFVNHRGHPRLAGTFTRVLGRYVREQHVLSLADAVRKMTWLPARRMEASVPQFRTKGRVRAGADADVTIFDPATVIDRATYEEPAQYSSGVIHVFVNGTPVVRAGALVADVKPGAPIRRSVASVP
jgi:dihydroorotase